MSADVGTGITVTFGTSGFSFEITNVDWTGIERPSIDTTHLGTTNARTFMPGDLYDPGELNVNGAFDPAEEPPFNGAAETITVEYPDGTTWAATGFLTGFASSGPLEEKMTADFTVKFSGEITITPGA